MNIFLETDYRKVIRFLVEEKAKLEPHFNFQELALQTRIPKSYLSTVLKGRAKFSPDQLYIICDTLNLSSEKRDFLLLLLERDRCNVQKRCTELDQKILKVQTKHLSTKSHIKATKVTDEEPYFEYYMNPLLQLVHVALEIAEFRKDLKRLSLSFGISEKLLKRTLTKLEEAEIISLNNKTIEVLVPELHLPKESKFYPAWRNLIRSVAHERLLRADVEDNYNFTAIFASDKKSKQEIQSLFMEYIQKAKAISEKSPSKTVYQMNFDLMTWTEE